MAADRGAAMGVAEALGLAGAEEKVKMAEGMVCLPTAERRVFWSLAQER